VIFALLLGAAWLALVITSHRLFLTLRRAKPSGGIGGWLTDQGSAQIGGEQPLSAAAVERHIGSIFAKLGHNEPPNTDCQWPPCSTT
jgi:hypothetical protein